MPSWDTHIDDDPLATGTHEGVDGSSFLYVKNMIFVTCDVRIGLAIHNETQDTDGLITAVTETTVTDDTNTWDNGDTYSIYKTAAKDTFISRIATDKSRGWKVTEKSELNDYGWFPKDHDIDKDSDGHKLPKDERPPS